jgi:hypothetical protein
VMIVYALSAVWSCLQPFKKGFRIDRIYLVVVLQISC